MDAKIEEMENLYTMDEVAEIIRLCRNSIYLEMRKGRLPSGVKIGGRRFWRESELNSVLKSGNRKVERNNQKKSEQQLSA